MTGKILIRNETQADITRCHERQQVPKPSMPIARPYVSTGRAFADVVCRSCSDFPPLKLGAREIPLPVSISSAARALLAGAYASRRSHERPALHDHSGWSAFIHDQQEPLRRMIEPLLTSPGATLEERTAGEVSVFVATPEVVRATGPRVMYYIHGGGWVMGAGTVAAVVTKMVATLHGIVVHGIDYRMPPSHPFPTPLDDCMAGYLSLLEQVAPKEILVMGASAGGNLAAALMLRLADEGHPRPGALVLDTPATDLTAQSDTLFVSQGIDSLIGIEHYVGGRLYAGDMDLSHPYISPLFGDLSRGFPATYLRSGTRDLLLSDTVRMHAMLRKFGVEADLFVGEGMPHGGFDVLMGGTPEDQSNREDLLRWIDKQFCS